MYNLDSKPHEQKEGQFRQEPRDALSMVQGLKETRSCWKECLTTS